MCVSCSEIRAGKRQHGDQQEAGPAGGLAEDAAGVPETADDPLPGR